MKNKCIYLSMLAIVVTMFSMYSCTEDSYVKAGRSYSAPSNLQYMDLLNARDHSYIKSARPTVDSQNLMASFVVTSVTDDSGNELSDDSKAFVSVINPISVNVPFDEDKWYVEAVTGDTIKSAAAFNTLEAGCIVIADGNDFEAGTYHFDVAVTTTDPSGNEYSTTFDNAFNLTIQPRLVKTLMYWPVSQNLVPGNALFAMTTKALPLDGNKEAISYQLGDSQDVLKIDPVTGVLSLVDGFTTTERLELQPQVQIVNNVTQEVQSFSGSGVITVVVSPSPVSDLPTLEYMNAFYPPLTYRNSVYGFTYKIVKQGIVAEANFWKTVGVTNYPNASDERPTDIGTVKAVSVPVTVANQTNTPIDVWMFMNAQNLTMYKAFHQKAVFYMQTKYLEYMPDGSEPTEVDVMVSTDYIDNLDEATWVKVNDQITCEMGSSSQVGMPYYGDLTHTDGESAEIAALKDANQFTSDGNWFKCTFDLDEFASSSNVTVAFRVYSTYEGEIVSPSTSGNGRPGNFTFSDIHYVVEFN
ncbi:MAG: hypothetical protein WCR36_04560 [Bacteroidaceae bacterium]